MDVTVIPSTIKRIAPSSSRPITGNQQLNEVLYVADVGRRENTTPLRLKDAVDFPSESDRIDNVLDHLVRNHSVDRIVRKRKNVVQVGLTELPAVCTAIRIRIQSRSRYIRTTKMVKAITQRA